MSMRTTRKLEKWVVPRGPLKFVMGTCNTPQPYRSIAGGESENSPVPKLLSDSLPRVSPGLGIGGSSPSHQTLHSTILQMQHLVLFFQAVFKDQKDVLNSTGFCTDHIVPRLRQQNEKPRCIPVA